MAFTIRITDGSNPLFTFTDGVNCIVSGARGGWHPSPAVEQEPETQDRLDLLLIGGIATIQENIQVVERWMAQAKHYNKTRQGEVIYLEVQIHDEDPWQRSRILWGWFDNLNLDQALRTGKMPCSLTIERLNYFETSVEVQVPLTNGNGTNDTLGLTVYNCSDESGVAPNKRVNWVAIAGEDVEGHLPAACRLEITNTYNDSSRASRFWIAHNVFSSPATYPHILEGESSTIGTVAANSFMSDGESVSATWDGTAEALLFSWPLSTALLNCMRGSFVRAIARFTASVASTTWLRLKIKASLTTLWSGPLVQCSNGAYIQELCTFRLPPYLLGAGDLYPLTLELYAQDTLSGAHGLGVDFLQLSPVDGWRVLVPKGYNLAYTTRVVDDGMEEVLYSDGWSGAAKFGQYVGYGERIMLQPGRDQRLYFLHNSSTGSALIDRTLTVKVFYRPRRRAL